MGRIEKGFVHQDGISLEHAIRHAPENGFDFIEIILDGRTERRRFMKEEEEILSLLDDNSIGVIFHLPWRLDIGSPLEHVREGAIQELQSAVDVAAQFGGGKAVVHASSNAWEVWGEEDIQDNIIQTIEDLDEYGEERGCEVCVENMPEGYFCTHDFDVLLSELDASMCLDTGHAYRDGMKSEEISEFIERYKERISHIHINDAQPGGQDHVPFGSGMLDFETIIHPLRSGWSGTLSLEPFTFNWDYIAMSKRQLDELI